MSRPAPIRLRGIVSQRERTSLQRRITVTVRNSLLTQHPPVGSRIPSTHELMRKFGVSYMTMQLALGNLVREGWLVRHRGKGTFVARNSTPRPRPSHSRLALVLPPPEDIRQAGSENSVLHLLYGSNAGAFDRSTNLAIETFSSSNPPEDELCQMAEHLQGSCDGCLFISRQFSGLIQKLQSRLPVVVMYEDYPEGSSVTFDQREALRLVVNHFREHGYQRLGYLGRLQQSPGVTEPKFRLFNQAVEKYRLTTRPEWFCDLPTLSSPADVQQAIRRFLRQPSRPQAVFAEGFHKAEVFILMMESEGLRVPEDMALMTYGPKPFPSLDPSLSLVETPAFEIGREAARLLDRLIRNEAVSPSSRVIAPPLVLGRSCGCPGTAPGAVALESTVLNEPSKLQEKP